ncbi:MAG: hypothetical protein KatS3mg088_699 [Patescibacteria group bacterium]|nr:MAG: hypothetical protein KatS3mg088_699 [Patescibacteria group bacterium]
MATEIWLENHSDSKNRILFGAEGEIPQENLVADEPLVVTKDEYLKLQLISEKVVSLIDNFDFDGRGSASVIGADLWVLGRCRQIDSYGNSEMRYGGLDIYKGEDGSFKILEVNPRVQAMGLQDLRQDILGIHDQPSLLGHLVDYLKGENYSRILILGSRKNPFWRAYERVVSKLSDSGMEAVFCDAEAFVNKYNFGSFTPYIILRFCSNNIFTSKYPELEEIIRKEKIPVINPLISSYFGYRGFMRHLVNVEPQLFPGQIVLGTDVTEEQIIKHPWIKLEAAGEAYVVKYTEIKRWAKDVLRSLIARDFGQASSLLLGKSGGDALRIKEIADFLERVPAEQVVWLCQEDVSPITARLSVGNSKTDLKILLRVYWFKGFDDRIRISLEAFGCTSEQFGRSKGKINAGTGISVPVVVE